jgi:hypothetical protein
VVRHLERGVGVLRLSDEEVLAVEVVVVVEADEHWYERHEWSPSFESMAQLEST